MDRNLIFQHILTKIYWKNTFKISLQYLENELRHLCPLNPIPMPDFCFDGFRDEDKFCFVNVVANANPLAVQQAEGGWQWQTHLETGFYPHHQTPDLRHLCGLELFGNRPDFWGIFLPQDERRCAI